MTLALFDVSGGRRVHGRAREQYTRGRLARGCAPHGRSRSFRSCLLRRGSVQAHLLRLLALAVHDHSFLPHCLVCSAVFGIDGNATNAIEKHFVRSRDRLAEARIVDSHQHTLCALQRLADCLPLCRSEASGSQLGCQRESRRIERCGKQVGSLANVCYCISCEHIKFLRHE